MGLSRFFRRHQWDDERARELAAYIEIETGENIGKGMSPEEARAAAHRKLEPIRVHSPGRPRNSRSW